MAQTNKRVRRYGIVPLLLIVFCLMTGTSLAAGDDGARIVDDPPASVESTTPAVEPTPLTYEECINLDLEYVAARQAARACHPLAEVEQCTVSVGDALICPCPTIVSRFNVTAIQTMEEAKSVFDAAGCHGFWDCVGSLCPGVYGASCLDDPSPAKPGSNRGQCVNWGW